MNISYDILTDGIVADNEIDALFGQLEHFEPPTNMVDTIMNAVKQLPLAQIHTGLAEDECDVLVVNA
ncbi:MAG TPA: hypothetical protein VL461_12595 [Dictyobacter sp.]|jgi:hypothetical protein|nr:hypothetical protein [Dictyobacter sp.]